MDSTTLDFFSNLNNCVILWSAGGRRCGVGGLGRAACSCSSVSPEGCGVGGFGRDSPLLLSSVSCGRAEALRGGQPGPALPVPRAVPERPRDGARGAGRPCRAAPATARPSRGLPALGPRLQEGGCSGWLILVLN